MNRIRFAVRGMAFRLSLVIAFASGGAALAHEVIWTSRLVDMFGAAPGTFSKVIGAFFLGLAFGAWIASKSQWDGRRGWLAVGVAELTVGLLALPLLYASVWSEPLYSFAGLGSWLRLLLPLVLVTPPAMAMGLVLPWLIEAASRSRPGSENLAVWMYAANTIGGAAGLSATLFVPVPEFGLTGAGLLVCSVNLVTAALSLSLFCLAPRGDTRRLELPDRSDSTHRTAMMPEPTDRAPTMGDARWLAFASGFLVLSLEVMLQHQFAQVMINSQWASVTTLGLVVLSLAVAAAAIPVLIRRVGQGRALRIAVTATVIFCAVQPFVFTGVRGGLEPLSHELTNRAYVSEMLKLGALAASPVLVTAGMIFPLLLRRPDANRARTIGQLFAVNGAGGWLGAEVTQGWLAPRFGLWSSIELVAGGYLALWGFLYFRTVRHQSRSGKVGPIVCTASALFLCTMPAQRLPQAAALPDERIANIDVGREGVVAVVESGPGDWRVLLNNAYTLGGSLAQFSQERQALLPLLLRGQPKSVATLGVATGSTVAGAASYPEVERIDAIELSPLVLQSAEKFFAPYNRGVFRDSRVKFILEDARLVMARNRDSYDVVVGDLFVPWRTGEGRLFAREHFENVRRALKPGGLFCQWVPLFQLTRPEFDAIVRTFRAVFPDTFMVRADFYTEWPTVALVGGIDLAAIDWDNVAWGARNIRGAGVITDPLMRHAEGVAMLVLGPAPDPGAGPVNTLGNNWLEWDASRNVLGQTTQWFTGPPWAEYARTVQRAGRPMLPEALRDSHQAGGSLFELECAETLGQPVCPTLRGEISEPVPAALVQDRGADWSNWPSRRRIVLGFEK